MNHTLNPEQQLAVTTTEGPILVLAGAGSGKTRVVTFRIAHLLQKGVPPSKILGLTFTNKAAGEMRERVHNLTQSDVLICTFHGLGSRILRESIEHLGYHRSFTIYDEDDVDRLLKSCLDDVPKVDLKIVRNAISRAKNSFIGPDDQGLPIVEELGSYFRGIYRTYQTKLKDCHAVDYDDLLFLTATLFRDFPSVLEHYQERWSHLLIDEYQDTNALQYSIVKRLTAKHHNICVVGDPDQSIYSWRGADISNIMNFEEDYPNAIVVRLDQNYRSKSNILNAANAVITRNENRYDKKLWSALGDGEKIKVYQGDEELDEARYIGNCILKYYAEREVPLREMVIFYRTNAQSRVFEDILLRNKIPYVIVGGISFYQRREIKDVLCWLRIIHSGADLVSFERTINLPKRGLGDSTLEKIRAGASEERRTIFAYCEMLVDDEVVQTPIKLSAKQKAGLNQYVHLVRELREMSQGVSLPELIIAVVDKTSYREHLELDPETAQERIENLNALISKATEWKGDHANEILSTFLEELSLRSTLDETSEGSKERVSLMTIHNGKGLEFSLTFLAGMEEDLFPHVNSREKPEALEEERRLCYVGMTRAKEYLYLSSVNSRLMWGVRRSQRQSRFIREIPRDYIEVVGPSRNGYRPKEFAYAPQPQTYQQPKSKPFKNMQVAQAPMLPEGALIFHQEFGIGQIRAVVEGSEGKIYRIFFQRDQSEKSLVAQFAAITPL